MNNLAKHNYDREIDKQVKEELMIAGISVIDVGGFINNEVKTRYIGFLNGFIFYRAWTYWVVKGYMPLEDAKNIYKNYKDLDIRAGGHCGNVNPEEIAIDPTYQKKLQDLLNDVVIHEYMEKAKEIKIEPNDPKFVDCYHVDKQLGLNKLVEYIKTNNIYTEYGIC